jgi:hypothetical protein
MERNSMSDYNLQELVRILEEKSRTIKSQAQEIKSTVIGHNPEPISADVGHSSNEYPTIKEILMEMMNNMNDAIMDNEEMIKEVRPDFSPKKGKVNMKMDYGHEAKSDHGDYY